MAEELRGRDNADGTRSRVLLTTRTDGDLARGLAPAELRTRRRALVDLPWSALHQVHGDEVVTVSDQPVIDARGDALVTDRVDQVLSVQVADCAPVALLGEGAVGVAHAGWRGLEAGVLARTAAALRALGANDLQAVVGACISAPVYEFGADDLDRLAERFGPGVRARTGEGTPALDLRAGIVAELATVGVTAVDVHPGCTATDDERFWSHRARAEPQRQVLAVWRESA